MRNYIVSLWIGVTAIQFQLCKGEGHISVYSNSVKLNKTYTLLEFVDFLLLQQFVCGS